MKLHHTSSHQGDQMHFLYLCLIVSGLMTTAVWAESKSSPSIVFSIKTLNSPVSEKQARFEIKIPKEISIDKVSYFILGPDFIKYKPEKPKETTLIPLNQNYELRIPVTALKDGFYQLHLKLIDKKKKEHEYKANIKNHIPFVVDRTGNPPTPTPNQNLTLLGIDSDDDGIRDDVQLWIENNHKSDPEVYLALKQLAYASQQEIKHKDIKDLSIAASIEALKAANCLSAVGEIKGVPIQARRELENTVHAMHENTKERIQASFKASENFSGSSYRLLPKEEACNF
jgi:hypothetical protein